MISVYPIKIKLLWKCKAYLRVNILNLRELPKWCTTWLKHLEKRSIPHSWLLLLWNASALSGTSQPLENQIYRHVPLVLVGVSARAAKMHFKPRWSHCSFNSTSTATRLKQEYISSSRTSGHFCMCSCEQADVIASLPRLVSCGCSLGLHVWGTSRDDMLAVVHKGFPVCVICFRGMKLIHKLSGMRLNRCFVSFA